MAALLQYSLFVFFSLISLPGLAQHSQGQALDTSKHITQFMVDSWTRDQGFPHNSIMAQVKSKEGYFWLVTFDGLVRFDGLKSEVYNQQNTPAFGTNSLLSIMEDKNGRLWIGTNGKGIVQYVEDTFLVPEFNEFLANGTITSIIQGEDGLVWVGTRGGLICLQEGVIMPVPEELELVNVYSLALSKDGSLWVGTLGEGLWQYNGESLKSYSMGDGLKSNSIRSILSLANGRVWIGTEDGLNTWTNGRGIEKVVPELQTFVNSLAEDGAGTIWAGTDEGLFRCVKGHKSEILPIGNDFASDAVQHVFCDQEGNLWLGTYHHGLVRLRDGKFRNFTVKEGLPNPIVNVVLPDATGTWVGTDNGLVFIRNSGTLEHIPLKEGTLSNRIRDMIQDGKGSLLIGTYDGLYRLENGQVTEVPLGSLNRLGKRVRRLLKDDEANIWIGTNSGLYFWEKGASEKQPKLVALENTYIMALTYDTEGRIWVGTNGAGVFTYSQNKLEPFVHNESLSSGVIFDVFQDQQENFWILTNNGLSRFADDTLVSANERTGLFANALFQMLQDGSGNYWITSNRGIYKVRESSLLTLLTDGKRLKHSDYKQYTKADGLYSSEITPSSRSAQTPQGHFWFATLGGASSIDPLKTTHNARPPKVLIEKVLADKRVLPLGSNLVLPPDTRYFEFYYTGLNYSAPSATRFRYRLENFEEVWHEAGTRREAYYTNLPAGEYTFRLMAVNEDGVWSEEEEGFSFTKEAYFYEQSWFIILIVLIIASLGCLVYFLRVRKLVDQNDRLNKVIEKRTADIKAQRDAIESQKEELGKLNALKDKLLSIISHDLRGPLSSTMGILHLFNQKQISGDELRQFSGELSQYVGQQVNMLDNLLNWSRGQMNGFQIKPVQLNLRQLAEETIMVLRQDSKRKNIKIENLLEPELYVLADYDLLQLVIRNLLINALKFTSEGGLITIESLTKNGLCQIEVADNGIGMTKEQLADIFRSEKLTSLRGTFNEKGTGLGLAICKEFVEKWGGKIWAESYFGKGSRFKFTVHLYVPASASEEEQPVV